jgi:hypothetical protein
VEVGQGGSLDESALLFAITSWTPSPRQNWSVPVLTHWRASNPRFKLQADDGRKWKTIHPSPFNTNVTRTGTLSHAPTNLWCLKAHAAWSTNHATSAKPQISFNLFGTFECFSAGWQEKIIWQVAQVKKYL